MSDLKVGDLVRIINPAAVEAYGMRAEIIGIFPDAVLLTTDLTLQRGTIYHVRLENGLSEWPFGDRSRIGFFRTSLQKIEDDGERKVSSWDDCIWKPVDLKSAA